MATPTSARRWAPLHELEQRYGAQAPSIASFAGVSAITPLSLKQRRGSADVTRGSAKQTRADRHAGAGVGHVAKLIGGFEDFRLAGLDLERLREQEAAASLHRRCLEAFKELERMETELELNFQAASAAASATPASQAGAANYMSSEQLGSAAIDDFDKASDEVVLQLELRSRSRSGLSSQGLLLRSPWAWELSSMSTRAATPSTRSCTPAGMCSSPMSGHRPKTVSPELALEEVHSHTLGDGPHTLCLDLCERVPEFIVLRRVPKTGHSFCGEGLAGTQHSHDFTLPVLPRQDAGSATSSASTARGQGNADVDARLIHLGDVIAGKLAAACQRLTDEALDDVVRRQVKIEESGGQDIGMTPKASASGGQDMFIRMTSKASARTATRHLSKDSHRLSKLEFRDSQITSKASVDSSTHTPTAVHSESIQEFSRSCIADFLRDFRAALQMISSVLPCAARALESAIKGLVLAATFETSMVERQNASMKARISAAEAEMELAEQYRKDISRGKAKIAELQEKVTTMDVKWHEEVRALRNKCDGLKEEINRMTPDHAVVDRVAGLLNDCCILMEDMEEETGAQNKILGDLESYTKSVAGVTTRDALEPISLSQASRVIELQNGEILLRPYDVGEFATQVTDSDLTKVDYSLPVRLRTFKARHLLALFETSRNAKKLSQEELCSEIDKIYEAKIAADLEADAAGLPHSELLDFTVQFYLESLGSYLMAQERVFDILATIRSYKSYSIPLKVSTFARFLEFCDIDKALPLPALDVVLQVRRHIQVLSNGPQDGSHVKSRKDAMKDSHSQGLKAVQNPSAQAFESQRPIDTDLDVAVAYDAAVKALPGGGTPAARRELFSSLVRLGQVQSLNKERPVESVEMNVLMLLMQWQMQQEAAPRMRDLVHRAEHRVDISAEEFREALFEAKILGIDDAVWRQQLTLPMAQGQPQAFVSPDKLLDLLGGGATLRLPRVKVDESSFYSSLSDALVADWADRSLPLQKLWDRHEKSSAKADHMQFADIRALLQSVEPGLSDSAARSIYLSAVEASRTCSQLAGDACPQIGTPEPMMHKEFGGDIVTFRLLQYAVMKHGLVLGDSNGPEESLFARLDPSKGADKRRKSGNAGNAAIPALSFRGASQSGKPTMGLGP